MRRHRKNSVATTIWRPEFVLPCAIITPYNLIIVPVVEKLGNCDFHVKNFNAVSHKDIAMIIFRPRGPYSSVSIVTGLRTGQPGLISGRGSRHLCPGVVASFEVRRYYRSAGGCRAR
jgi:hypothetical protein